MSKYVHGLLKTQNDCEWHFRYTTEGQSLTECVKMIEEKHCKSYEILWIAKGYISIDSGDWQIGTLEEAMKPKFEPSDAGRYVAIKDGSWCRFGIVIEVLDKEDARIWIPNINLEEGGRGTACIININEVVAFGDWVKDIDYPSELVRMVSKLQSKRRKT